MASTSEILFFFRLFNWLSDQRSYFKTNLLNWLVFLILLQSKFNRIHFIAAWKHNIITPSEYLQNYNTISLDSFITGNASDLYILFIAQSIQINLTLLNTILSVQVLRLYWCCPYYTLLTQNTDPTIRPTIDMMTIAHIYLSWWYRYDVPNKAKLIRNNGREIETTLVPCSWHIAWQGEVDTMRKRIPKLLCAVKRTVNIVLVVHVVFDVNLFQHIL